jgi:hypothetical protein
LLKDAGLCPNDILAIIVGTVAGIVGTTLFSVAVLMWKKKLACFKNRKDCGPQKSENTKLPTVGAKAATATTPTTGTANSLAAAKSTTNPTAAISPTKAKSTKTADVSNTKQPMKV